MIANYFAEDKGETVGDDGKVVKKMRTSQMVQWSPQEDRRSVDEKLGDELAELDETRKLLLIQHLRSVKMILRK